MSKEKREPKQVEREKDGKRKKQMEESKMGRKGSSAQVGWMDGQMGDGVDSGKSALCSSPSS